MRAVDTNILVRLIARDDDKQVAAAERFIKPGAWIPLLVLQERLEAWIVHGNLSRTDTCRGYSAR